MTKASNFSQINSSFRDPSGFLFRRNNYLYRQINLSYKKDYDHLLNSGLYKNLISKKLLIPHEEISIEPAKPKESYKVIQPQIISFISYPYEWSFSQLKDAALATLKIQKIALEHNMCLKDASAYNIQFHQGSPILIDTLSFEVYEKGSAWTAYRQFCQHFLAPLALMARKDIRLNQLLRIHIDGIPLDLASKLLPPSTKLNLGLLIHIHLHAQAYTYYANKTIKATNRNQNMSKEALQELIIFLEKTIKKLEWKPVGTEWANYYSITNYSNIAFEKKKETIVQWIKRASPSSVWDLGANTGEFSRLASEQDIPTIAFDIDPAAVEQGYRKVKTDKEKNLLPLLLDLTNPSPALGWHHTEQQSFIERGPAEMVLALALIHHLAISNNVPLIKIAEFMAKVSSKWVIAEFVLKDDEQVQKLFTSRVDIFEEYTSTHFEAMFEQEFNIEEKILIPESKRILFFMKKK